MLSVCQQCKQGTSNTQCLTVLHPTCDVPTVGLAGMGCGNGVTAIGLVRDILQARPNSIAVFVPAEITTYAFYPGEPAGLTLLILEA